MAKKKTTKKKKITTLTHTEDKRTNIPTAELESVISTEDKSPIRVAIERRNPDCDPQLVWRGKDASEELVVGAPPLYIQEKIHPKVLVDDLKRKSELGDEADDPQMRLFSDFNGLPDEARSTEFYQHEANWTNRLILGDSLQVMASLAEREGLRSKVQCIYFDPPYGIKFNSNFQWSTASKTVADGKTEHITREPEQVKAFRDTWQDGIHSYLTYLRDRLLTSRDLLSESGAIFVQIGDENVHRIRALMDEVFGEENCVATIAYKSAVGMGSKFLDQVTTYILFYAKNIEQLKYRQLFKPSTIGEAGATRYLIAGGGVEPEKRLSVEDARLGFEQGTENPFFKQGFTSRSGGETSRFPVDFRGKKYRPTTGGWRTNEIGIKRTKRAARIAIEGRRLTYKRYFSDFPCTSFDNIWDDISGGIKSRSDPKIYVVQTSTSVIERCILMCTDPGDLVVDPTCGAGTTGYVAEQLGRRWITIDTSRVALTLARTRIMGAKFPYFLLADSKEGQAKQAELQSTEPSATPTAENIRHGFINARIPRITLRSIAHNSEIDVIWDQFQTKLEPQLESLNKELKRNQGKKDSEPFEEWSVPHDADESWSAKAKKLHTDWWKLRIERQKEIDASIAVKADFEYLYDKPYEDKSKVRVAGPFTVETLSPHRVLAVDHDDELIDPQTKVAEKKLGFGHTAADFVSVILENLKTAGVQQAHKEDKIDFTTLSPWPGRFICAEGKYETGEEGSESKELRAGIFIGPEFGTVNKADLTAAAREAGDAGFDVLITCAFSYDAHCVEFTKLGSLPILQARMNADLHMAEDLKNTGAGNLFVIFGEPDIDITETDDNKVIVKINGVDVFHPNSGEVRSDNADGIACWFIDTDYNEESFFVRHAYFLGANDPYKSLKRSLKAEINEEAWETLNSDTSRPFRKPSSGRIAVKVINHLGDEVMKVFKV